MGEVPSGLTFEDLSMEEKKPKTSPAEFIAQVRAEARKVVWPSRQETI